MVYSTKRQEKNEGGSYQGPSIPINNDKLDMVDQEANVLLNLHEMALSSYPFLSMECSRSSYSSPAFSILEVHMCHVPAAAAALLGMPM